MTAHIGMPQTCLLLHGFTGGPYELMPLVRRLEQSGYRCVVPTLPGHGGRLKELYRFRYTEWVRAAEQEAETLTERCGAIDVVGFSMGGLLAAHVANRYPVRRMALLNAAVYYFSPLRMLRHIVQLLRSGGVNGMLRDKRDIPVGALIEFTKLVRALRPEFSRVVVPTFIAQGELDEVVHPLSADYIARRVQGDKTVATYPQSRHMICFGPDAPLLFRHIEQFFTGKVKG